MKPSKQGSEATQYPKGQSGNPGGLTVDERAARDAIRKAIGSEEWRVEGLAAYRQLLQERNPLIVKDWLDRVAGKVKERVELSEDPDSPRTGLDPEQLVEFALWRMERRKIESLPNALPAK